MRRSLPNALMWVALAALPACDPDLTGPLEPDAPVQLPSDGGLPPRIPPIIGEPDPDAPALEIADDPRCDHLDPRHCMLPWPSDRWLYDPDVGAWRLDLAYEPFALPHDFAGRSLDPSGVTAPDGFSPIGALAAFPNRLPAYRDYLGPNRPDRTLLDDAQTALIDLNDARRIAHWIEIDPDAGRPTSPVVLVRPTARLAGGRSFVFASVAPTDADGHRIEGNERLDALVENRRTDSQQFEGQRPHLVAGLQAAALAGINVRSIESMFVFTTGTLDGLRDPLRTLAEDALARIGERGLGCRITSVEAPADDGIGTLVRGTFRVPDYLADDPPARIRRDMADRPQPNGQRVVEFAVLLPSALPRGRPVPVVQVGVDLFQSPVDALSAPALRRAAADWGVALAAIEWVGLSTTDRVPVAAALLQPTLAVPIAETLQQAIIEQLAFARTLAGTCSAEAALRVNGAPVLDPARRRFLGVGLGAQLGPAVLALSPDLDGGVLIGAGGGLADIFARGADFATSMPVIEARYPEPHDRRLLLLLAQHIWDPVDAGLWIDAATDGFGANPARPVLLLTIPNDRRVPNDTTWFLARTAQLPIIEGSRFLPWGVPVIEGPHTGSALMVLSSLSEPPDHRALLTDARALSIIGRYLLSATIDPT